MRDRAAKDAEGRLVRLSRDNYSLFVPGTCGHLDYWELLYIENNLLRSASTDLNYVLEVSSLFKGVSFNLPEM